MINIRMLLHIVVSICLLHGVPQLALAGAATTEALDAQTKALQKQIDSTTSILVQDITVQQQRVNTIEQQQQFNKELLLKDIQAQNMRIDGFEKQVETQAERINDLNLILSAFGILITVLIVAIGFFGYKTAKTDAKKTAEEAAKQWFEENSKKLYKHIHDLSESVEAVQSKSEEVIDQIGIHAQKVEERSVAAKAEIEKLQKEFVQDAQDKNTGENEIKTTALDRMAEELKSQPESSYSYEDWNARAFAAAKENKLEEAVYYWGKAAAVPAAGIKKSAQALFNKSVALGKQNRLEEAIKVSDELIVNYSQASEIFLREQVAKSINHKGILLQELERYDEALEVFEELISNYSEASEISLREEVARAMFSKGVVLKKLKKFEDAIKYNDLLISNFSKTPEISVREIVATAMLNNGITLVELTRYEEAISVYDEIINSYGNASEIPLRNSVAGALNNKGFYFLCNAKKNWDQTEEAKKLLNKAAFLLMQGVEKYSVEDGYTRGNQAYVAWLLGDKVSAEQFFLKALEAKKYGGTEVYNATLKDFEIHPIAPDQGFRELIDRLWIEYQQKINP